MQGSLPFAGDVPSLKKRYPHLTRQKTGAAGSSQRWSLEALQDGLRYFFELHHRAPSLHEADTFDYLPSERTIRRSFGTVSALRACAEAVADRDAAHESVYQRLVVTTSAMRVHERFRLRPSGMGCDFFLYAETGEPAVIINLMAARTVAEVKKALNVNRRLYRGVDIPIVLILTGERHPDQRTLDAIKEKRQRKPKIRLITLDTFEENPAACL